MKYIKPTDLLGLLTEAFYEGLSATQPLSFERSEVKKHLEETEKFDAPGKYYERLDVVVDLLRNELKVGREALKN